jgi:hypothetical protein
VPTIVNRSKGASRRRGAELASAAQLQAVHREVRDHEERDRTFDVDHEGQERRAERGEAEADRALDEGG